MVIAVDFDGTIAKHTDPPQIGGPVPLMVQRVKDWLREGHKVVIFSARVWPVGTREELTGPAEMAHEGHQQLALVDSWIRAHIGQRLEITCVKSPTFDLMYDDRGRQVVLNKGELVTEIAPAVNSNKVTKVGAGYVYVKGTDYRCGDCWKFIKSTQQCAELASSDTVKSNGTCILWSYGASKPGMKPTGAYTKAEVGYTENPNGTLCRRCEYFNGADACQKVEGAINPHACCSNQEPR